PSCRFWLSVAIRTLPVDASGAMTPRQGRESQPMPACLRFAPNLGRLGIFAGFSDVPGPCNRPHPGCVDSRIMVRASKAGTSGKRYLGANPAPVLPAEALDGWGRRKGGPARSY